MPEIDYDEIARRFRSALSSRSEEDGYDYDEDEGRGRRGGRIPYDRFAAVRRERDEARQKLEELAGLVESLKNNQEAALSEVREAAARDVQALQARHVEDLALVDQGFSDPLGRAALRQAWEAAPSSTRGKSPAAYWADLMARREAHASGEAEDAPAIPATLRGYLPAEEPAPAAPSRRPPPAPAPRAAGGELPAADNMADWLQALQRA